MIDEADVILDVSGGDSFTDLYGRKRFFSVIRPQADLLQRKKPLILLPQTYGPFEDPTLRQMAADVIRRATMCWARDERSFEVLRDLLGDHFDPEKHRCGVDMAFGLQPRKPGGKLESRLQSMLAADRERYPLVGFNVSGLIYQAGEEARTRYRFRADYNRCVEGFLRWLLESTTANWCLSRT